MNKLLKKHKKDWTITFQHGGKDVVFPYAVGEDIFGLVKIKTITKPWKFIKIDKNLHLLIAVCKKLKTIVIDLEPYDRRT